MRRDAILVFAMMVGAFGCAIALPTAKGQSGKLPNPVAQVDAKSSWTSDAQPPGTYAIVGGRGTPSQRINLPNGIDIDVTGAIGPLNAPPPGNQLRVSNRSAHGIIIEFVLPGNKSATPINPPNAGQQGISNNLPPAGTGNVRVTNSSGKAIKVHYRLPQGKTYAVANGSFPHVWSDLNDGEKDDTPSIAAGTKVTVDGYNGVLYVQDGVDLVITIRNAKIEHGYAAAAVDPKRPQNPRPNASPQLPQVRVIAPRGSNDQKAGFQAPPARFKPPQSNGPKWRLGLNFVDAPLGIRVTNVDQNTPAANLGLEPGDFILDVTGRPVGYYQGTYYDLSDVLDRVADGQGWVNLNFWNFRNGQTDARWVQLNRR